ncbi:MAG: hypothetical protein HQ483_08075 [Rhodospirillales bacterium]|nr:hypothetical protein [Rhodospirillales bacterium]
MTEILTSVLFDGRPAIKITDQRGDPEKGRLYEHVEYHVMAPTDAERLGRELIKMANGGSE